MTRFTKKIHSVVVAGRKWEFAQVTSSRTGNGRPQVSLEETVRVNTLVARAICMSTEPLTGEEFDFLSRLTRTSYAETARRFNVAPFAPESWVAADALPQTEGRLIKSHFANVILADF